MRPRPGLRRRRRLYCSEAERGYDRQCRREEGGGFAVVAPSPGSLLYRDKGNLKGGTVSAGTKRGEKIGRTVLLRNAMIWRTAKNWAIRFRFGLLQSRKRRLIVDPTAVVAATAA